jgi:hypothetical protein
MCGILTGTKRSPKSTKNVSMIWANYSSVAPSPGEINQLSPG